MRSFISSARLALLVLLASALVVVGCATWMESRVGPDTRREAPPAPGATDPLAARALLIPVQGVAREKLRDNFDEARGKRKHNALDIMAPRGTPVVAADDGRVAKVLRNAIGGLTVYQYDRDTAYAFYYAHLDRYAPGIKEGVELRRGDLVGYVGSTGNAPAHAPHLHFTMFRLGPEKKWWKGDAVNPYPYLY